MDDLATCHFTVHGDPQIDAQIREDVLWLRDEILREFPQAKALFLVGGFGRGEGGVVLRGGRWRPANDYDLELITSRREDHARLRALGERLAEHLGIAFVHVENSVAWRQWLRGPTEYTVDLRFGSLALHDPHHMRGRLWRCRPDRTPLHDALATLFTRASALMWRFESGRDWKAAPAADRLDLANQISKALLAIEDAWLIRARAYHPSYQERLRSFLALKPANDLAEAMRWATDAKLRPDLPSVPDDLSALWFRVRDLHRLEVLRHVAVMCGGPLKSVADLGPAVRRIPLPWEVRLRLLRPRAKRRWETRTDLAVAHMVALAAISPDGQTDEALMASARAICGALGEQPPDETWESLRRTLNGLFTRIW
jgi:hypothetical protein